MHRTVYRIRPGVRLAIEQDGRYRIELAGSEVKVRLHPPALAPILMVDGWRSEEEIERRMAKEGNALPLGVVQTLVQKMVLAGVLEETRTPWRPLVSRPWPAHHCVGCGASCQGHWVGPLRPDFVARTTERMPELREKYPHLVGEKPFIRLDPDDPALYLNASTGQCIFLDEQMRCILHKEFGPDGKPTICRMFPYVRFEDGSETRIGLGLMCLKHFDQVLDDEEDAPLEDWEAVHAELDGRLFHFYPPGDAEPVEGRILDLLRGSADPLDVVLEELAPRFRRPVRAKVGLRLERLARKHLARLEGVLAEEPIIVELCKREGLLPERINAIRELAREGERAGGRSLLVLSPEPGRAGKRPKLLEDALFRFHFLRHYLMFHNVAHGLAALALGVWVGLALTEAGEGSDRQFGEYLATWMRVIQSPGVRRELFRKPEEVDAFLSTFRSFWRRPSART